ncbi:MAG: hypothetical protein PHZ00_04630, partial [Candidatus Peribacteraceae bacterium]|nr:hypothetical protein [Candidatus Peribacteraceae bacterium]
MRFSPWFFIGRYWTEAMLGVGLAVTVGLIFQQTLRDSQPLDLGASVTPPDPCDMSAVTCPQCGWIAAGAVASLQWTSYATGQQCSGNI